MVEGHNQDNLYTSNEEQIPDEINGNKVLDQNPILNNFEISELQKTFYENLHRNLSLQNNVDNNQISTLTGYRDPLLLSEGPNSCMESFGRIDSIPPILLQSINDPVSSIPLPDIDDNINSVALSPLGANTPAPSMLSTPNHTSVGSSHSRSRTRRRNETTKAYKGKGRKVNKDQWIDNKRKNNKNSGKSYDSRNVTKRPARKLKPLCNKCQFKCPNKFNDDCRKEIFNNFWNLCSNVQQWDFIAKYCIK